jgi:hypothetical protein
MQYSFKTDLIKNSFSWHDYTAFGLRLHYDSNVAAISTLLESHLKANSRTLAFLLNVQTSTCCHLIYTRAIKDFLALVQDKNVRSCSESVFPLMIRNSTSRMPGIVIAGRRRLIVRFTTEEQESIPNRFILKVKRK